MTRPVNPSRTYDASRRREQARRTRRAVVDVAHARFLADGYAATTMGSVAADAGVSVETVYKAFGNKAGLLKAVFDVAVVGDDEPIPMLQREFVRQNLAEPDPAAKLRAFGVHVAAVGARAGPIQLVVRAAAETDPGAGAVWQQVQDERLTGLTVFGEHLAAEGHLRPGVGTEEARDVLWVHSAPELWDLLVRRRGWDDARFATWVGEQLVRALL